MKKSLFTLLMIVLVSCGGSNSTQSGNQRLQIAVEKNYVAYFSLLADRFITDYSRDIDIEVIPSLMFPLLEGLPLQKGNSADLFMVMGVDALAEQRLITPLTFSLQGYTDNAMISATYKDQHYFVPMSSDTTLLFYNTNLVNSVPTMLKDLDASQWAAKFTDFYFAAGLFHSLGGYIFDDQMSLGIANNGSIEAGQVIQQLFQSTVPHWSMMRDDSIAYDVMMKSFMDNEVAYMINGPWALSDLLAAGMNVRVNQIPSWDGRGDFRTLVGTKGIGVNAYSRNAQLAQEFLQFLATQEHAQLWYEMTDEVATHTGVVYPEGSLQAAAFAATANGMVMPNHPALATIWKPMNSALSQIANNLNVENALKSAKLDIESEIARVNY